MGRTSVSIRIALHARIPAFMRLVAGLGRQRRPLTWLACNMNFFIIPMNRYDKDHIGYLDRSSLRAVLLDLGALDGLRPSEVDAAVGRAFSLADRDNDGRITAEEFARCGGASCYATR
jgi:hypothetical protein